MTKIPVSLIVDDSGPVNTMYFHDTGTPHELVVPPAFVKAFARVCRKNGIKGKFSVVPMPCGLGRLDRKLNYVPQKTVRDYIRIIKNEIEPVFSLTPEILTHFRAYNIREGYFGHVMEDVYFSTLTAPEIEEYVGLALEILCNTGLNPTGVTSPWMCGIDNEKNYAEGIGRAFRKKMNKDVCFYFLHCQDEVVKPVIMCNSKETGKVVSIPENAGDALWDTQNPWTAVQARKNVRKGIDAILSADGRRGLARELFEKGLPVILICHWQGLFADGRCIGLDGLDHLAKRLNKVFGDQIEWVTFEELANRA